MDSGKIKYFFVLPFFLVCLCLFGLPPKAHCELPGGIVSASWLADNLSQPNLVVLDVRLSPQEYKFGHIPGAVCAFARWRQRLNGVPFMLPPLDYLKEKLREFGVNNKSDVIIYADGHTLSAIAWACRVAWTLDVLGHNSVAVLDGGISQWMYESRPLDTKIEHPPKGDFVPDLDVTKLATIDDVRFLGAKIVDMRVPARYFGIEKGRTTARYGHIPGSLSVPSGWLLVSRIPRLIKPREEIENIVYGAGLPEDKDKEIIVLCDTGHLASLGYWVFRYVMGYKKVRLFDGSMVEYCMYPLPLVRYSWPLSGTAMPRVTAPVKPATP